jgi:hypothetical protein
MIDPDLSRVSDVTGPDDVRRLDVQRLANAYDSIKREMDGRRGRGFFARRGTRSAAKILCDELRWLVIDNNDFWVRVGRASQQANPFGAQEQVFLKNIEALATQEEHILRDLDVSEYQSQAITRDVYGALRIVNGRIQDGVDPTPEALANLRSRLDDAHKLVCAIAKGPLRKLQDDLIGIKGAKILLGAVAMGANTFIPAGPLAFVSLKAGGALMLGGAVGLLDLLPFGKPDIPI